MPTVLTEAPHAGAYILSEANGWRSREKGTLAASQDLVAGQIVAALGLVTLAAAAIAVAGNTGAATITASPAVAAGTAPGVYKLTAVSAGATAAFLLEDPEGVTLGEAITGTAATIGGIGPFTITDAGTDPAIGDQFTITVTATPAATAGQIVAYDPDATNGAETPIGVNFAPASTGAGETKPVVYHARDCEVSAPELTWPTGIDTDVKAAALAALGGHGIIVR